MTEENDENGLTPEIVAEDLKHWGFLRLMNAQTREAVVFRVRLRQPAYQDTNGFTTAVTIGWRYESQNGFPVDEDKRRMEHFEDAIDELTWFNGYSELFWVATGTGLREWLFYTRDRALFMNELNRLLSALPDLPLDIEFLDDPDWTIWLDILERAEPVEA